MERSARCSRRVLVVTLLGATALPAQGRLVIVEDVNAAVPATNPGSTPTFTTGAAGSSIGFAALEPSTGAELWVFSPATGAAGLVKDVWPGEGSSEPDGFVEFLGRQYFAADDSTHGRELWSSDGTPEGTSLVADLRKGALSSDPTQLTVVGLSLYFVATGDGVGRELWSTDGTAKGTTLVADIRPGGAGSEPNGLRVAEGLAPLRVVFSADDGSTGREPWIAEPAGARRLKDIRPGSEGSDPDEFALGGPISGYIAFAADDGTSGREPWISDGSEGGTAQMADVQPGGDSNPHDFVLSDPFSPLSIAFVADDGTYGAEPWSYGPTDSATLLKDVRPGPLGSDPQALVAVGAGAARRILFVADDGVHGREPWTTDETATGTKLLADLRPGAGGSSVDVFRRGRPFGTVETFFVADDGSSGPELWVTDLTAAGTRRLADLRPGSGGSLRSGTDVIPLGDGRALLSADDGTSGRELWLADAGGNSVKLVGDLNPPQASSNPDLPGVRSPSFPGTVFVSWDDGQLGPELWRYDTFRKKRMLVADILSGPGGSNPRSLTVVDGILYFVARDGLHGSELWRSDGTAPGTFMVKDIHPGQSNSLIAELAVDHKAGALYFSANDGTHGVELWKSDGTPSGTVLVVDLEPGGILSHSYPKHLMMVQGTLFFSARTAQTGRELWKSDGTAAGTMLVMDIRPGSLNGVTDAPWGPPGLCTAIDGILLFRANSGTGGVELWRTDGKPQGTRPIDIWPGGGSSWPVILEGSPRDGFFLSADHPTTGRELWWTDATVPGTTLVRDIVPGTGSSDPEDFRGHGIGNRSSKVDPHVLYFSAATPATGREPWLTDGTAQGTTRIADLNAGPASSIPEDDAWIARLPGSPTVLFMASDGNSGFEAWRTDGTTQGTVQHSDIAPGPRNAHPSRPILAGSTWLFAAYDGRRGRELWKGRTMPGSLRHGQGCAGTNGLVPRALPVSAPALGNPGYRIAIRDALPSAPAFLLLGLSTVKIPLGGCQILISPILDALPVAVDPTGSGSAPMPVPDIVTLIGARLTTQFVVVDPGGTPPGLTFSDGLIVLISSGKPNQFE